MGAGFRPLSSCRGPQAALKCYYRSDTVTRDGAMVLSVRAAQNETRKGFWAGTGRRHRTPVGILQRPSCPRRKQHQSTRSAECGNGGGRSSCRGSLLAHAASRGRTKSSQVAMWSLGKSAMSERNQGHQSVARPHEFFSKSCQQRDLKHAQSNRGVCRCPVHGSVM